MYFEYWYMLLFIFFFFPDLSQSYLVFIVERFSDVIDVFGYR